MTEKNLFNLMKKEYFKDLVEAKDKMSRWDCYSSAWKCRIELKCRERHYSDLMIERSKYDALIRQCKNTSDIPLYINSTPKGVYYFDLRKESLVWSTRKLPSTTEWGGNWIDKEVGYLKINKQNTIKLW